MKDSKVFCQSVRMARDRLNDLADYYKGMYQTYYFLHHDRSKAKDYYYLYCETMEKLKNYDNRCAALFARHYTTINNRWENLIHTEAQFGSKEWIRLFDDWLTHEINNMDRGPE